MRNELVAFLEFTNGLKSCFGSLEWDWSFSMTSDEADERFACGSVKPQLPAPIYPIGTSSESTKSLL
jgi:hypothetical protein